MSILEAIILAIIEGVTEFLPISSTGHMILASTWMGLEKIQFVKNFEIIIQFGAILSVLFLYWRRFLVSKKIWINISLAFLPTAAIGFAVRNHIDELLGSPFVVAWSLFLGGIALIASDRLFSKAQSGKTAEELTPLQCILLGVFQSIAMIPGVSRSAATILGGLGLGLSRKESAEFSFLLAVPTLGAAGGYKLLKMLHQGDVMPDNGWLLLLMGSFVAFLVAIAAIKGFISILQRFGFSAFGYYRILLGALVLYVLMTT